MSQNQYAAVLDLNKCIGCHTCSVACKKQWTDRDGMAYMYWNNVETHPGQGYPRGWHSSGAGFDSSGHLRPSALPPLEDYGPAWEYDYGQRLFEGRGKPVMPQEPPKWGPNWEEDMGARNQGDPYYFYIPRLCNHCTNPACLAACPRKAIYKREEDGIVVIDQERCRGYRHCIKACPYKKIYFNAVTKTSQKCIFCYPRLERGQPQACVAQCVGRLRFVGLLGDPRSPVHRLVREFRVALPLLPWLGTGPNVYYIPPIAPTPRGRPEARASEDPRIPPQVLEGLFGKQVHGVVEFLEGEIRRAQAGEVSDLLQLLIGRSAAERYHVRPDVVGAVRPAGVAAGLAGGPELSLPGAAGSSEGR